MTKTMRKLLAAVLAVVFVFSVLPVTAGAEKVTSIQGIALGGRKNLTVNETFTIRKSSSADELWVDVCGWNNGGTLDYEYNANDTAATFRADGPGVYLVYVENLVRNPKGDSDSSVIVIGNYWVIITVAKPGSAAKNLGRVTASYDTSYSGKYKEVEDTCLWSEFDGEAGSDGIYYTEYYVWEDGNVYVDGRGVVETDTVGVSHGECYVIDAQGSIFRSDFTAKVSYTWWQWLIRIFFLGFLWY